jgi:hypothetical protein
LWDHPDLQDTNDRAKSIHDFYGKQAKDAIKITDITSLNIHGMFLDHVAQEKALGQ